MPYEMEVDSGWDTSLAEHLQAFISLFVKQLSP